MADLNDSMMSPTNRKPTGMKGKVQNLASTLYDQKDHLRKTQTGLQDIRNNREISSNGLTGHVDSIRNYFKDELAKMQEDFRSKLQTQELENSRLQQQVTQLKKEKTIIHQQVLMIQEKIDVIEDEIGHE